MAKRPYQYYRKLAEDIAKYLKIKPSKDEMIWLSATLGHIANWERENVKDEILEMKNTCECETFKQKTKIFYDILNKL